MLCQAGPSILCRARKPTGRSPPLRGGSINDEVELSSVRRSELEQGDGRLLVNQLLAVAAAEPIEQQPSSGATPRRHGAQRPDSTLVPNLEPRGPREQQAVCHNFGTRGSRVQQWRGFRNRWGQGPVGERTGSQNCGGDSASATDPGRDAEADPGADSVTRRIGCRSSARASRWPRSGGQGRSDAAPVEVAEVVTKRGAAERPPGCRRRRHARITNAVPAVARPADTPSSRPLRRLRRR